MVKAVIDAHVFVSAKFFTRGSSGADGLEIASYYKHVAPPELCVYFQSLVTNSSPNE